MGGLNTIQYLIIVLGWGTACFFIYFLFNSSKAIQSHFNARFGDDAGTLRHAITAKLIGAVLMGPATLWLTYQLYGPLFDTILGLQWNMLDWKAGVLLLLLAGAAFLFIYLQRRNDTLLTSYPERRLSTWNGKRMRGYLMSWVLYLIGYEILFRGLLLLSLIPWLGLYWGLAVHVLLYGLAHLHKNRGELIGSVLFGAGVGYFCIATASIVPAIVLHLVLSLSTQYFAIRNGEEYVH